jgi:hypothetical protein
MIFGTLIHITSRPGLSLKIVQLGAQGHAFVKDRVLQILGFLDSMAQLHQTPAHQCFLEKTGVPGGARRLDGRAFAGFHVQGQSRGGGQHQRDGGNRQDVLQRFHGTSSIFHQLQLSTFTSLRPSIA